MDGSPLSMPIEPDTKDWTWVLERPCPECGFDAPALAVAVPRRSATTPRSGRWSSAPTTPRSGRRRTCGRRWSTPATSATSPALRRAVRLMLAEDDPTFANWDQDVTAVEQDYGSQDPATVGRGGGEAAEAVASDLRRRHR